MKLTEDVTNISLNKGCSFLQQIRVDNFAFGSLPPTLLSAYSFPLRVISLMTTVTPILFQYHQVLLSFKALPALLHKGWESQFLPKNR